MRLFDLSDDHGVAPQIQHLHDFTLEVYRALANHRRRFQFTVVYVEFAVSDLVSFGTGHNSAVVCLPHHIRRRYINRESIVLFDAYQGMPVVL